MSENELLRGEFEKENVFLNEIYNTCSNKDTRDRKALQQQTKTNMSLNNTQKTRLNEKKKKLTLTSQSSTRN